MIGQVGAFAEIEVTPETILIRRAMTQAVVEDVLGAVSALLVEIGDEIERERQQSDWDGEDVSAEAAYRCALFTISETIKSVVHRAMCSRKIHS